MREPPLIPPDSTGAQANAIWLSVFNQQVNQIELAQKSGLNTRRKAVEKGKKDGEELGRLRGELEALRGAPRTVMGDSDDVTNLRSELEEAKKREQAWLAREKAVKDTEEDLKKRERELKTNEESLSTREGLIRTAESTLKTSQDELTTSQTNLQTKEENVKTKEDDLVRREGLVKTASSDVETAQKVVKKREEDVQLKEEGLKSREELLQTAEAGNKTSAETLTASLSDVQKRENAVTTKEGAVEKREEVLKTGESKLVTSQTAVENRESAVQIREVNVNDAEKTLEASQNSLKTAEGLLKTREADVSLKENAVGKREETVQSAETKLDTSRQQLLTSQAAVKTREEDVLLREGNVGKREVAVKTDEEKLAADQTRLTTSQAGLDKREQLLASAETQLKKDQQAVAGSQKEAAELKSREDALKKGEDALKKDREGLTSLHNKADSIVTASTQQSVLLSELLKSHFPSQPVNDDLVLSVLQGIQAGLAKSLGKKEPGVAEMEECLRGIVGLIGEVEGKVIDYSAFELMKKEQSLLVTTLNASLALLPSPPTSTTTPELLLSLLQNVTSHVAASFSQPSTVKSDVAEVVGELKRVCTAGKAAAAGLVKSKEENIKTVTELTDTLRSHLSHFPIHPPTIASFTASELLAKLLRDMGAKAATSLEEKMEIGEKGVVKAFLEVCEAGETSRAERGKKAGELKGEKDKITAAVKDLSTVLATALTSTHAIPSADLAESSPAQLIEKLLTTIHKSVITQMGVVVESPNGVAELIEGIEEALVNAGKVKEKDKADTLEIKGKRDVFKQQVSAVSSTLSSLLTNHLKTSRQTAASLPLATPNQLFYFFMKQMVLDLGEKKEAAKTAQGCFLEFVELVTSARSRLAVEEKEVKRLKVVERELGVLKPEKEKLVKEKTDILTTLQTTSTDILESTANRPASVTSAIGEFLFSLDKQVLKHLQLPSSGESNQSSISTLAKEILESVKKTMEISSSRSAQFDRVVPGACNMTTADLTSAVTTSLSSSATHQSAILKMLDLRTLDGVDEETRLTGLQSLFGILLESAGSLLTILPKDIRLRPTEDLRTDLKSRMDLLLETERLLTIVTPFVKERLSIGSLVGEGFDLQASINAYQPPAPQPPAPPVIDTNDQLGRLIQLTDDDDHDSIAGKVDEVVSSREARDLALKSVLRVADIVDGDLKGLAEDHATSWKSLCRELGLAADISWISALEDLRIKKSLQDGISAIFVAVRRRLTDTLGVEKDLSDLVGIACDELAGVVSALSASLPGQLLPLNATAVSAARIPVGPPLDLVRTHDHPLPVSVAVSRVLLGWKKSATDRSQLAALVTNWKRERKEMEDVVKTMEFEWVEEEPYQTNLLRFVQSETQREFHLGKWMETEGIAEESSGMSLQEAQQRLIAEWDLNSRNAKLRLQDADADFHSKRAYCLIRDSKIGTVFPNDTIDRNVSRFIDAVKTLSAEFEAERKTWKGAAKVLSQTQGDDGERLEEGLRILEEREKAVEEKALAVWKRGRDGDGRLTDVKVGEIKNVLQGLGIVGIDIPAVYTEMIAFDRANHRSIHPPTSGLTSLPASVLLTLLAPFLPRNNYPAVLSTIRQTVRNATALSLSSMRTRLYAAVFLLRSGLGQKEEVVSLLEYQPREVKRVIQDVVGDVGDPRAGYASGVCVWAIYQVSSIFLALMGAQAPTLDYHPASVDLLGDVDRDVFLQAQQRQHWATVQTWKPVTTDPWFVHMGLLLSAQRQDAAIPAAPSPLLALLTLCREPLPLHQLATILLAISTAEYPPEQLAASLPTAKRHLRSAVMECGVWDGEQWGWLVGEGDAPMDSAGWRALVEAWAVGVWGDEMKGLVVEVANIEEAEEEEDGEGFPM